MMPRKRFAAGKRRKLCVMTDRGDDLETDFSIEEVRKDD